MCTDFLFIYILRSLTMTVPLILLPYLEKTSAKVPGLKEIPDTINLL